MMQNIMFQDNLFQLTRSIDVLYEGLMLDLSSDVFFDKTVDDLLFFDASIRKLVNQLSVNTHITGYSEILHSLHSCQNRYIQLVDAILSGKTAMRDAFRQLQPKLAEIRKTHAELQENLVRDIGKIDKNDDSRDIVSSNELSELLNF